jgi:Na+:H+ antiporter, NhaA family
MSRSISPLRDFLHRESAGGILLLAAAILGLLVANSPISERYFSVLEANFELGSESLYLKLTTLKVINYLLMTIFFLVVGLEIKRELTVGHLASFKKALSPFIAAVGGMAVPAAIYLAIAGREAAQGWGVPVATDIALAVGLLGLMGTAVLPSLRTFLLGLAVIDDIGAILIIAFIYSTGVNLVWLVLALVAVMFILFTRNWIAQKVFAYFILGIILWYGLYRAGVHPTLAGVILGLLTPHVPKQSAREIDIEDGSVSVIEWLENKLHPLSTFIIVPLFAFANTGVVISTVALENAFNSRIAWGIFAGLVIGKPVGIFLTLYIAKKVRIGEYPEGANNRDIAATASAAGIGFTVAIFIAQLAFKDATQADIAVLAVIAASIVSGLMSWVLFLSAKKKPRHL